MVEMARRADAGGCAQAGAAGHRAGELRDAIGSGSQLFNKTVVTPGQVAQLLDEAEFERIVFNLAGRPIDVSRRQRFFTGATRRAIEILDRTCTTRPAATSPPMNATSTTSSPTPTAAKPSSTTASPLPPPQPQPKTTHHHARPRRSRTAY